MLPRSTFDACWGFNMLSVVRQLVLNGRGLGLLQNDEECGRRHEGSPGTSISQQRRYHRALESQLRIHDPHNPEGKRGYPRCDNKKPPHFPLFCLNPVLLSVSTSRRDCELGDNDNVSGNDSYKTDRKKASEQMPSIKNPSLNTFDTSPKFSLLSFNVAKNVGNGPNQLSHRNTLCLAYRSSEGGPLSSVLRPRVFGRLRSFADLSCYHISLRRV